MLELRCQDVNECDFVVQGQTHEQTLEAWVDHVSKRHGMRYIPPELYSQIQRKLKAFQTERGLEVPCKDVIFCDFITQGETPEQVLVATAEHATKEHGMMSFPPQWYVQMRLHMRPDQGQA